MLCNICQSKDATVHFTKIVEGKMHKVDLCKACAKDKGIDDPSGFSLADVVIGLGTSEAIEKSDPESDGRCSQCGFSHTDFKKTGRLGCPDCYKTFQKGLETMLKTMHKGVLHVGKVPFTLKKSRDFTIKIEKLEVALDKAVGEEQFEQAAVFRDEINDLKKKLEKVSVN
jgi:protein arginine kinase activator